MYTDNRSILFNELASGDYNVLVQASVNGKYWSDNQITLNFKVYPPYYSTWWFRSVIAFLIVLIIYLFFRFRVLTYNRHLVREILRLAIRKLKPKSKQFVIRQEGKECKIDSEDVLFVKSEGNYIHIYTVNGRYYTREKISDFFQFSSRSVGVCQSE